LSLGRVNRPESLSELARRELRSAIVDGRLKLGDQLSEHRLSAMLGISKTPVREALQQLQREGLVKIDPQRGTSIFGLADIEIDQIGAFRALLELAAARAIFARDRSDSVARMDAVIGKMRQALASGDIGAYRACDAAFHQVIVDGGANHYLAEAYVLIAAKVAALRSRAQDDRGVVDRSLVLHAKLLELLRVGQQEEFCLLLEEHIRNAGRDYRAWLVRQQSAAQ
jgi:DNA-binding GntR family transcriptional regulator